MNEEKLLKLLNMKFGTKYKALKNLIAEKPYTIQFIKDPSPETILKVLSLYKISVRDKELNPGLEFCTDELIASLIEKLGSGEVEFTSSIIVENPRIFNLLKDPVLKELVFFNIIKYHKEKKPDSRPFLAYIENPTTRMKFFSVQFEPESLKYLDPEKRNYNSMATIAINKDPEMIKYVPCPTADMRQIAIIANPFSIKHIKNQALTDAKLAFEQCTDTIEFINPEHREITMLERALEVNPHLPWLTAANFKSYRFSQEELNMIIEKGESGLYITLAILVENGDLEITEEQRALISEKLGYKFEEKPVEDVSAIVVEEQPLENILLNLEEE